MDLTYHSMRVKSGVDQESSILDPNSLETVKFISDKFEMDFLVRFWELMQKYINESRNLKGSTTTMSAAHPTKGQIPDSETKSTNGTNSVWYLLKELVYSPPKSFEDLGRGPFFEISRTIWGPVVRASRNGEFRKKFAF